MKKYRLRILNKVNNRIIEFDYSRTKESENHLGYVVATLIEGMTEDGVELLFLKNDMKGGEKI